MILLVVAMMVLAQPPKDVPVDVFQAIEDERALISVANGLDVAVDAKDWQKARSYFTDRIRVDFSSLSGAPPAEIAADDLIAAWSTNLFAEKASFHLRGNHIIELAGDEARLTSHGYAWNRLERLRDAGGDLWEVWGVYDYALKRTPDGWKISSFTFRATHQRGNRDVPVAAKE